MAAAKQTVGKNRKASLLIILRHPVKKPFSS
jgi:hypothetical protein